MTDTLDVVSELARAATLIGGPYQVLADDAVRQFVAQSLGSEDLDGRSVCVIVPDGTRSCPLPLLLSAVHDSLHGRASHVTVLIALGTHAAMSDDHLAGHLGYTDRGLEATYPGMTVLNHEWWRPETFTSLGRISAERVAELSDGRFHQSVEVVLNRAVVDHDVSLVVGPVFPHEVVGFSGGNKYFFPGVAGPEVIDFSHWLGALITSADIIGTRGITPVRALIDAAADMVRGERHCLGVVGDRDHLGVRCLTFGSPGDAWAAAADVAAETHVVHLDEPVQRVVSLVAPRYADLWTGAKGLSLIHI